MLKVPQEASTQTQGMDGQIVQLTWREVQIAGNVGWQRCIQAMEHKRQGNFQLSRNFHSHITGSIGEYAVAKYYGIFWPPAVGEFNEKNDLPDFGHPVDIKCSCSPLEYETACNVSKLKYEDTRKHYEGITFFFVQYWKDKVKIKGFIQSSHFFNLAEENPGVGYNPDFFSIKDRCLIKPKKKPGRT